jgi:hypothetical protein
MAPDISIAFSLFEKSFKSYDKCSDYVRQNTNDQLYSILATSYGCANKFEFYASINLPDGVDAEVSIGKLTSEEIIARLVKQYPNSFNRYIQVIFLPDGTKVKIPQGILAKDVWADLIKIRPDQMKPLTVKVDRQKATFGMCLIDNIRTAISDKNKHGIVVKCGDKAEFTRSKTLELASIFSEESRVKNQIEDISRVNRLNNILNQPRCTLIGGGLGVPPLLNCD